jgi:putative peptidoglycan lipid II flippase
MPWLLPLLALGFTREPSQLELAASLTRITFPYLLFISLVSLQGGVLTSLHRFAAVAATPVLLNLFQIGAVLLGTNMGSTARVLCWGVTAAGLAQFLWLMASCARENMALRLLPPRLTSEMRHLIGLMVPGVFGAGVTQINLLVSTNVASFLPTGSISYLQYADRLNQLPLAVVGIAVGTAILPTLSRQIRSGDERAANETQNRGLELALFLTLPAAAALAVISEPILTVLFQRGRFDAAASHATAQALAVYAAGLPAFVLVKVLAPAFYARQDTKTPVKVATASLVLNLVLTLGLAVPLHHVGNALATTLAGWLNAAGLTWFLYRKGHFRPDSQTQRRTWRIVLAAVGMALALVVLQRLLGPTLRAATFLPRVGGLVVLVCGGLGAYAGLALVTGAADWRDLARVLRRRQPA